MLAWLENSKLGNHFRLGSLTVYGWNAMHVALSYYSKYFGYICFHPPGWLVGYGKHWPWYFYISPNATPWAAWIAFGPGIDREDKDKSEMRRKSYIDTSKLVWEEDLGWRIPDAKKPLTYVED